jgi:hypothetical protein
MFVTTLPYARVVRVLLAVRTPVPLRLVPFLDECTARGLMRRIGGG